MHVGDTTTVGRLIAAKHRNNIVSISASPTKKFLTPPLPLTTCVYPSPLTISIDRRLSGTFLLIFLPILLIFEELSSNPSLYISKTKRLDRRITLHDSSSKLILSKTVRLTFDNQQLPSHINLFYVRYPVHIYVPLAKICYNCFRFE